MAKKVKSKINIGAVNASSITKDLLSRKPEKVRATLYLEEDVYAGFQKNCKKSKLSVSEVTEELMRRFNESINK